MLKYREDIVLAPKLSINHLLINSLPYAQTLLQCTVSVKETAHRFLYIGAKLIILSTQTKKLTVFLTKLTKSVKF